MKKGDIVRCRYKFVFEAVNDDDLLTVRISRTPEERDYIVVPLYLHGIGFQLPPFDYCLPGSYLPATHPDYYRESTGGFFFYANKRCKISFDANFMYTGKYWLVPVDAGEELIIKHAILRSSELRKQAIEDTLGQTLDGELIEGQLMEFIIRDSATKEYLGTGDGLNKKSDGQTRVYGYIRDMITGVEFEFPMTYLITKP